MFPRYVVFRIYLNCIGADTIPDNLALALCSIIKGRIEAVLTSVFAVLLLTPTCDETRLLRTMAKPKWYAVTAGRDIGVFDNWCIVLYSRSFRLY